MKRRNYLVVAVITAGLSISAWALASENPLRRSESDIQAWVRKQTPIGSAYADVLEYAQRKEWCDRFARPGTWNLADRRIRGHLGHYRGLPWRVYVEVVWDFDAYMRLQEIKVRKDAATL